MLVLCVREAVDPSQDCQRGQHSSRLPGPCWKGVAFIVPQLSGLEMTSLVTPLSLLCSLVPTGKSLKPFLTAPITSPPNPPSTAALHPLHIGSGPRIAVPSWEVAAMLHSERILGRGGEGETDLWGMALTLCALLPGTGEQATPSALQGLQD